MDGYDKNEELEKNGNNNETNNKGRDEIFSKVVRAGKRTYFLDVKTTRKNDYYLTITESKKRFNRDGKHYFEKHKVFLYKEDFDKFTENLHEVIDFIKTAVQNQNQENESFEPAEVNAEVDKTKNENYTSDIDFDDLGETKE